MEQQDDAASLPAMLCVFVTTFIAHVVIDLIGTSHWYLHIVLACAVAAAFAAWFFFLRSGFRNVVVYVFLVVIAIAVGGGVYWINAHVWATRFVAALAIVFPFLFLARLFSIMDAWTTASHADARSFATLRFVFAASIVGAGVLFVGSEIIFAFSNALVSSIVCAVHAASMLLAFFMLEKRGRDDASFDGSYVSVDFVVSLAWVVGASFLVDSMSSTYVWLFTYVNAVVSALFVCIFVPRSTDFPELTYSAASIFLGAVFAHWRHAFPLGTIVLYAGVLATNISVWMHLTQSID
jgi:hypothetical protein